MADHDAADLFAIPDFWKRPSWPQLAQEPLPPLRHDGFAEKSPDNDGFFTLALPGSDERLTLFLGTDEEPPPRPTGADDGGLGSLFRPPPLLGLSPTQPTPVPPVDTESAPAGSIDHTPAGDTPADDLDDLDLWLLPPAPPPGPTFQTWTSFAPHVHLPPHAATPLLATEQGPRLVDALIAVGAPAAAAKGGSAGAGRLRDARDYCACLLALALGRSSVLFAWDAGAAAFRPALSSSSSPAPRISGFTADALRSVEATFLPCGTTTRALRAFVERALASSQRRNSSSIGSSSSSSASRVALARAVDGLLLTIQSELGRRAQRAHSLLQLQALVQPVASLVQFVWGLVAKLEAKMEAKRTPGAAAADEAFVAMLFDEAQSMEHSAVFMRDVTKQLLQLVSEPWLAFVREWLGLDPRAQSALWWRSAAGSARGKGFVRVVDRRDAADGDGDGMATEPTGRDFVLDAARMPAFVPDEMARDLFETGRNLRFLWDNHPDHPLSDAATIARAGPPPLRWHFDWAAIHALDGQARAYERTLAPLLGGGGRGQPNQPALGISQGISPADEARHSSPPLPAAFQVFFGRSADQIEESIQASMAVLGSPLPAAAGGGGCGGGGGGSDDELALILRRQLFDANEASEKDRQPGQQQADMAALDDFAPHWSLLPLLSFGPVVAAQARLVNRACMRLLFGAHGLRRHLRLLRAFALFGNGVFCSRLAHALFDPGADDAGFPGGGGGGLGLGLRLSRRNGETWPPASSELRLALMGVLAESWDEGGGGGRGRRDLPGGLSFAVRDLSPAEMDACLDPDGLAALDFLRLAYTPPPALAAVLTPAILAKYDRIFRHLLRVLRMYSVVNQLMEEAMHPRGGRGPRRRRRGADAGYDDNVSARFRVAARHFVANLTAYFLDTGVGLPWQRLEAWLDGAETGLVEEGPEGGAAAAAAATAEVPSPERLRARHEQALDEMLLALLLRKRQQPLLRLLEDLFGLILAFAKSARAAAAAASHEASHEAPTAAAADHAAAARKLLASFRKKAAAFLAVCRGLSEKEADSVARKDYRQQQAFQDGTRAGEGSALSALLLLLDWDGAYEYGR